MFDSFPFHTFFPDTRFSSNISGNATSVNYPFAYPNNLRYSYIMSIPEVNSIRIEFEHFETEHYYDCLYYGMGDVPDENKALGSLNGWDLPDVIALQAATIWFLFVTDDDVNYSGFALSWEAVNGMNSQQS